MTRWSVFAGLTGVVLVLVVSLARLSQDVLDPEGTSPDDPTPPDPPGDSIAPDPTTDRGPRDSTGDPTTGNRPGDPVGPVSETPRADPDEHQATAPSRPSIDQLSSIELLANVALSQGVFAALLVVTVWYAEVPPSDLGIALPSVETVAVGAGLGVALYVANRVGVVVAGEFGIGHSDRLREQLAPSTAGGWLFLLGVVLPVIAGFEELLFRAALVGGIPAGFGVSPWLMAVVSSVAFGVGHGAQGQGGVLVTGVLGVVLAAAYVLTGSFAVVFVAHYLVNALEFVIHEGLGIEWGPVPE